MNVPVSDAPWSDLLAQVADAEGFLAANGEDIQRLVAFDGVEDVFLDFPINLRIDDENVVFQFDRFSASLVRAAGELGLALELSIYPPAMDEA